MPPPSIVQDHRTWWHSFSLQALFCMLAGALLPPVLYFLGDVQALASDKPAVNSITGSFFAVLGGLFLARKVNIYPGVNQIGSALSGFAISFSLVSLWIMATRLNYSVGILLLNFLMATGSYILFILFVMRFTPNVFYVVPGGKIDRLAEFDIHSIPLTEPALPAHLGAVVVADLHNDMPAAWERLLAQAALSGIPVFHYKQVYEAATGKVQVEHLSENSLGSLLPNMSYVRAKRVMDTFVALLLLPILLLPFCVVALAIKLDSVGPVFFKQERLGYRGRTFRVIKFRSMSFAEEGGSEDARRMGAITSDNDPRITRVGAFLRRTRIDELPQILNIIAGDMSWIGPRPEAVSLSKWYEEEIPFYSYRHIIRPGITGWAQVNQGHVTNIDDINEKLQFDFYYIKNFAYWLDLLIVMRTAGVVISGFGSK
jgi:lipopolysaccharide/colanic/teichoic acid biosynthesis glycosyltransferase